MPITFNEVSSIGDPLSVHSFQMDFPILPSGIDGKSLTYRNASVSLPELSVGQVISKPFGWTVTWAGRRSFTPSVTMDFIDTTDSPVYKTLASWQTYAAGMRQAGAKLKSSYAVNAECTMFDTVGEKALVNRLINIWPMRFKVWDTAEEAGAAHVSCEFSIDALDIINPDQYAVTEDELTSDATYTYDNTFPASTSGISFSASVSTDSAGFQLESFLSSLNLLRLF
jgi:hypothetical protein